MTEHINKLLKEFQGIGQEIKDSEAIYQSLSKRYLGTEKVEGTYDPRTKDAINEIVDYQKCLNKKQGEVGVYMLKETSNALDKQMKLMYKLGYR